jgi:hypothetical protein
MKQKKAAGKIIRLFVRLLSLSGREWLAAMMKKEDEVLARIFVRQNWIDIFPPILDFILD